MDSAAFIKLGLRPLWVLAQSVNWLTTRASPPISCIDRFIFCISSLKILNPSSDIGSDIINPPFNKLAQLYGAEGFEVNKVSEVNEALKAAIKCNKPSVINVNVDPKALYSFRRDSFKYRKK